jgi:AcrR family transcriptional regulator
MARPHSPRGQGRERVVEAALDLFAEHGVSGTSLQMIAERLGVTKAAVYFQFHAKDDIVVAVLQPAMDELADIVRRAQSEPTPDAQLDSALAGLIAFVVQQRQLVAVIGGDPSVGRVLEQHPTFQEVTDQLGAILLGPRPDPYRRVAASTLGAGLSLATADPVLADLDDETLRRELLRCAQVLLPHTGRGSPSAGGAR